MLRVIKFLAFIKVFFVWSTYSVWQWDLHLSPEHRTSGTLHTPKFCHTQFHLKVHWMCCWLVIESNWAIARDFFFVSINVLVWLTRRMNFQLKFVIFWARCELTAHWTCEIWSRLTCYSDQKHLNVRIWRWFGLFIFFSRLTLDFWNLPDWAMTLRGLHEKGVRLRVWICSLMMVMLSTFKTWGIRW